MENLKIKDSLARRLAFLLPARVVYWVIIRAFGHTSSHECANMSPFEIGFDEVTESWTKLYFKPKREVFEV